MNSTEFNNLITRWYNNTNTKYYFVLTKCCGYEFIVPVYKKQTLRELYYMVALEHDAFNISHTLYCSHNEMNNTNNAIPGDNTTVHEWVNNNRAKLETLTNPPDPLAYRLWFNDGHHNCNQCY